MLTTIEQMGRAGDGDALEGIWRLMGGEGQLPGLADGSVEGAVAALKAELGDDGAPDIYGEQERQARFVVRPLVESLFGRRAKSDPYGAERAVLADLAETFEVSAAAYPTVEGLEDAIAEGVAGKVREQLAAMSPDERRKLAENMLKQFTDEDRLRFIDRVLADLDRLDPHERDQLLRELADELGEDLTEVEAAAAGGAAGLLALLLARQAGFSVYLLSTQLLYTVASRVGLTLPFAAYMFKNQALGWLLGPVGLIVTTGLSAGWFGVKTWRRRERFKKLVQLVAYVSAWREDRP